MPAPCGDCAVTDGAVTPPGPTRAAESAACNSGKRVTTVVPSCASRAALMFSKIRPVCAAVNTVLPLAFVTSSAPASPAMNVSGVYLEPFASIGINGILIPFPPITGTQSGILRQFRPFITTLMAEIMPFITPVQTLLIASQIPLNMLFTPSQACFQLPVNTPVMNVINPCKTCVSPCRMPEIALIAAPSTPLNSSATA